MNTRILSTLWLLVVASATADDFLTIWERPPSKPPADPARAIRRIAMSNEGGNGFARPLHQERVTSLCANASRTQAQEACNQS